MRKFAALALLGIVFGMGGTCTITFPDDFIPGETSIALNRAEAEISIVQEAGGEQAQVTARITDSRGRTVVLDSDQAVRVNDEDLTGLTDQDTYTATIPTAGTYTIAVREPTRGEEYTDLSPPGTFDITTPAEDGLVSLSGFTLAWSNPDEAFQVEIEIAQTVGANIERSAFGPFTDTGSRTFTVFDLRDFVQGAPLAITVTKVRRINGVAGFSDAVATAQVFVQRNAEPLP
jgi:hypothetical protein